MDDDLVEWIRQQEQGTKNIMMKKNRKRRDDAFRRAPEDLSIHKWAETMPDPGINTLNHPISRMSESAPSRLAGRKRPLSSEGSAMNEVPREGTRISLASTTLEGFQHTQAVDDLRGPAQGTRILPPSQLERLALRLPEIMKAKATGIVPPRTDGRPQRAPKYDALPSISHVGAAIEARRTAAAAHSSAASGSPGASHRIDIEGSASLPSQSAAAGGNPQTPKGGGKRAQQRKINGGEGGGKKSGNDSMRASKPPPPHPSVPLLQAAGYDPYGGTGGGGGGGNLGGAAAEEEERRRHKQQLKVQEDAMGFSTAQVYLGRSGAAAAAEAEDDSRPALQGGEATQGGGLRSLGSGELLRVHWRDEFARESSWQAAQEALELAKDLEREEHIAVPVAVPMRHPVPGWLAEVTSELNASALRLIRAKNRLKRFSLDVKSAWRANMSHLREHSTFDHATGLLSAIEDEKSSGGGGGGGGSPKGAAGGGEEVGGKRKKGSRRRGGNRKGLLGGRDGEGISEGGSQVQSVALTRALAAAYFTPLPPLEPVPAPPSSDPAVLLPPLTCPPTLVSLCSGASGGVRLPHASNADGYGGVRYVTFVDRLTRAHSPEPRWRIAVYDRYSGISRRCVLTEQEALHLLEFRKEEVTSKRKEAAARPLVRLAPHRLPKSQSQRKSRQQQQQQHRGSALSWGEGDEGDEGGRGGTESSNAEVAAEDKDGGGGDDDDTGSFEGVSPGERSDTFDLQEFGEVVSGENVDAGHNNSMVSGELSGTAGGAGGVPRAGSLPQSRTRSANGSSSGARVSSAHSALSSLTLSFVDTGNGPEEESTAGMPSEATDAVNEEARTKAFEESGTKKKHMLVARALALLPLNPDQEPSEVMARGDLTVEGLAELRAMRLQAEKEAKRKAKEDEEREAAEAQALALAADEVLRDAHYRELERGGMESEEAFERGRLHAIAQAKEKKELDAASLDFFLMCDRTRRDTVRRKVFVGVLWEEPDMADALRMVRCLPFQALNERDRKHKEFQGMPLSKELLGMVFDEIDASSGFITGDVPLAHIQKYLLLKVGLHQGSTRNDSGRDDEHGNEGEGGEDGDDDDDDDDDDSDTKQSSSLAAGGEGEGGDEEGSMNTAESSKKAASSPEAEVVAAAARKAAGAAAMWEADCAEGVHGGGWEAESDAAGAVHPLSIRVSDRFQGAQRSRTVPGVVALGKPGLWWNATPSDEERTSAAGVFFRDLRAVVTSTPTVVVNMLLALDTPAIAPSTTAWDGESRQAGPTPDVPHAPTPPPFLCPPPWACRRLAPKSPYDTALSALAMVLSDAEMFLDCKPASLDLGKGQSESGDAHRRFWPWFNRMRFRQRLQTSYTLFPRPDTVCWTYAVSKLAMSSNAPTQAPRHTWHSEQRCVEQLGRRRGAQDLYHSLEFTKEHKDAGGCEAALFLCHLQGGGSKLGALERWTSAAFEGLYQEVKQRKEGEAKEEALRAKIEDMALEITAEKEAVQRVRGAAALARTKAGTKGRSKVRPAFGLQAWQRRHARSTLLAVDDGATGDGVPGRWQKWMDATAPAKGPGKRNRVPGAGAVFYVDTDPGTNEVPYQWDAPKDWRTSVLAVSTVAVQAALDEEKRVKAQQEEAARHEEAGARVVAAEVKSEEAEKEAKAAREALGQCKWRHSEELAARQSASLLGEFEDPDAMVERAEKDRADLDALGVALKEATAKHQELEAEYETTKRTGGYLALPPNPPASTSSSSPSPQPSLALAIPSSNAIDDGEEDVMSGYEEGVEGGQAVGSVKTPQRQRRRPSAAEAADSALELLSPDAAAAVKRVNARRHLVFALVSNPSFVASLGRKLVGARQALKATVRQRGEDADEDAGAEEGRELGSDEDPWSDSEDEAGDWEGTPDFQPLNYGEERRQRIARRQLEQERGQGGPAGQRKGTKRKPDLPEIDIPSVGPLGTELLPSGVGNRTVPRLLRPGVTIMPEPALDLLGPSFHSGSTDGAVGPESPSSLSSSSATLDLGGGEVDNNNTSVWDRGDKARAPRAEPRAHARWAAMAPPGRALAPHMYGKGWRTLPKAAVASDFLSNIRRAHHLPLRYTPPCLDRPPLLVGPWDNREETGYQPPSFERPYQAMFIAGSEKEGLNAEGLARASRERRRTKVTQLMTKPLTVREMLEQKASEGGEVGMFTSLDRACDEVAWELDDDPQVHVNAAVVATKNGNLEQIEALMEEHPEIDFKTCVDEHGSTLLTLAVQQGSKRFTKFWLRKHSDVNHQNLSGNTALHYAFEYNHHELGDYLISKGADSLLVNAEGCTAYEGLSQTGVSAI